MVAGLIHLVAPTARLMPVKVFKGDGTSSLFDILRGIYFAADRGARVINMSFSMYEFSVELMRAIDYANSRGAICVASAGNDGRAMLVYPAGLGKVIGAASTDNRDRRSIFSNYGDALVTVAAPGEGVVSLYPGKNYAAGWGTSFSAPLVAGGAALLVQIADYTNQAQAHQALSQAVPIGQGLGAGRLDLFQACRYRAERGSH
jgi:subtilisin family serine protease